MIYVIGRNFVLPDVFKLDLCVGDFGFDGGNLIVNLVLTDLQVLKFPIVMWIVKDERIHLFANPIFGSGILPELLAKLIVELLFFLLSWMVQRCLIFRRRAEAKKS